jgi:hypothetical protein
MHKKYKKSHVYPVKKLSLSHKPLVTYAPTQIINDHWRFKKTGKGEKYIYIIKLLQ